MKTPNLNKPAKTAEDMAIRIFAYLIFLAVFIVLATLAIDSMVEVQTQTPEYFEIPYSTGGTSS